MSEFSRLVRLDTIGDAPRVVSIEADAAEREALAARFSLVSIGMLTADAELARTGAVVRTTGRLRAAVVQSCVATGADIPAEIDELFALRFEPEATDMDAAEEFELDEGDLDVMSYDGSAIDLGEAVAQTLALALDPFPRAPDAAQALRAAGVGTPEESSPFAALKRLRDQLN